MSDLTQRVRAKYPGVYDDLSDADLEKAVLAKHPEYADLAAKSEPAAEAPKQSMTDAVLADNAALPWDARAGQAVARFAKGHPVATGATIGGALASGGTSLLGQLGLAALGAAGGAGYGLLGKGATTGDYGTPSDNAKAMATEAALSAGGEGVGKGVAKILSAGGKLVYKTALRPSIGLQRDFGDIAATGLREGAPVSEGGLKTVDAARQASADRASNLLTLKDQERPAVAGLLPPAQSLDLGAAPLHPTLPDLRDPRSAGVLRGRVVPSAPATGVTYPQLIGAQEVLDRGLSKVRGRTADAVMPDDAASALADLEQRFAGQRPNGMTLQEANRLKNSAQDLASSAYRAADRGMPINSGEAQFHKGLASGTRQAIESRVPEVGPINAKTQELIGLQRAMEDATKRNVPGVGSIRSLLGDFMPAAASTAAIGANRAAPAAPTLLRSLMAALGYQEQ